jgi:hypothetical protein
MQGLYICMVLKSYIYKYLFCIIILCNIMLLIGECIISIGYVVLWFKPYQLSKYAARVHYKATANKRWRLIFYWSVINNIWYLIKSSICLKKWRSNRLTIQRSQVVWCDCIGHFLRWTLPHQLIGCMRYKKCVQYSSMISIV